MITPEQCRAARALVGLTAGDLAEAAGIGHITMKRFESGRTVQADTVDAITAALQRSGVTFLTEGQGSRGGGIGLRLTGR